MSILKPKLMTRQEKFEMIVATIAEMAKFAPEGCVQREDLAALCDGYEFSDGCPLLMILESVGNRVGDQIIL